MSIKKLKFDEEQCNQNIQQTFNASDLKWDAVVKHFQGTDNSQIKKLICKKKCGIVVEILPLPVTSVKIEMVSI